MEIIKIDDNTYEIVGSVEKIRLDDLKQEVEELKGALAEYESRLIDIPKQVTGDARHVLESHNYQIQTAIEGVSSLLKEKEDLIAQLQKL